MGQKRAYTINELSSCNLEDYLTPTEFGEFLGILDYKMWGRSVNLWAFFTLEDGKKIKLSCFRSRKDESIYSAQDEKYNFAIVGNEGLKFKLIIATTKTGNIRFKSAELLN